MELLVGVSVAASVHQFADGIIKTCLQLYDFIFTIKKVPQEILGVTMNVSTLATSLRSSDV